MTLRLLALILVSVSFSALAQISLKAGMSTDRARNALEGEMGVFRRIFDVLTTYQVVGGLVLYVFSAALWLKVLSKADVSFAYPFVGLGFVLTSVFAWLFLGEQLGVSRIVGTALVVAGVVLVSRSAG